MSRKIHRRDYLTYSINIESDSFSSNYVCSGKKYSFLVSENSNYLKKELLILAVQLDRCFLIDRNFCTVNGIMSEKESFDKMFLPINRHKLQRIGHNPSEL